MSGWKIELLIIGFILLISTASAVMPTKITITSSADSDVPITPFMSVSLKTRPLIWPPSTRPKFRLERAWPLDMVMLYTSAGVRGYVCIQSVCFIRTTV